MPFEYFLVWLCIVGVIASVATPLYFKYQGRQHNKRINKIGQSK